LLGSLVSAVDGKKRDKTVAHAATELFDVVEVVPTEVMAEMDQASGKETEAKLVKGLLQEGATQIQLGTDTSVAAAGIDPLHAAHGADRPMNQVLVRYASRLVGLDTHEKYDLAIVATDNETLLGRLAEMAREGKSVLGVKSEQVTGSRYVLDKIVELANLGRDHSLTLEE
jgi:hypothetical protein